MECMNWFVKCTLLMRTKKNIQKLYQTKANNANKLLRVIFEPLLSGEYRVCAFVFSDTENICPPLGSLET